MELKVFFFFFFFFIATLHNYLWKKTYSPARLCVWLWWLCVTIVCNEYIILL